MSLELTAKVQQKKVGPKEAPNKITSLKELKDVNREKSPVQTRKTSQTRATASPLSKYNDISSKNTSLNITPKESQRRLTPVSNKSSLASINQKGETNGKGTSTKQSISDRKLFPITTRNKTPTGLKENLSKSNKQAGSVSSSTKNRNSSTGKAKDNNNGGVVKHNNVTRFIKKAPINLNDLTVDSKLNSKQASIDEITNKKKNNNSPRRIINTSLNSTSNNDSSIYKKKIIPKSSSLKTASVDKKVVSMLTRMEEFELAKQKRLESIKTKKVAEFLSQFKNVPTINEKSKKLIKDSFYSRMEERKNNVESKKKMLLEKHEENIRRILTPQVERKRRTNLSPINYVNKQYKWEKERQLKIESLREQEKMNEIKECPFRPEINQKSLQIVQKMESNHLLIIQPKKKGVSLDDFDVKSKPKIKLNLKLYDDSEGSADESRDIVEDVMVGKKPKKIQLNNYSTNKEELLIEKLFETKFNMLKQQE